MNVLKSYFKLPLITRVVAAFVLGISLGVTLSIFNDAGWVGTMIKVLSPFGTVLVSMDRLSHYFLLSGDGCGESAVEKIW